jgi:hypothetical protein
MFALADAMGRGKSVLAASRINFFSSSTPKCHGSLLIATSEPPKTRMKAATTTRNRHVEQCDKRARWRTSERFFRFIIDLIEALLSPRSVCLLRRGQLVQHLVDAGSDREF